jgi:hypothetical protein
MSAVLEVRGVVDAIAAGKYGLGSGVAATVRPSASPPVAASSAPRASLAGTMLARLSHERQAASTRSSQRFRSAISAAHTECGIGYSCHSTGWPERDERVARLARARDRDDRIGVPWARKIGVVAVGGVALGVGLRGERQVARQADQAGEPLGWRRPVISVIAQPWLKPARTMRAPAMPRSFSRAISARRAPATRAARLVLAQLASVEAEDVVPGAHHVAAVDRHRPGRRMREDEADRPTAARSSSCATGTKSLPSAPRPCRMIDGSAAPVRSRVRSLRGQSVSSVRRGVGRESRRCGGHSRTASRSQGEVVVDHERRVIAEALLEVDVLAQRERRDPGVARW